MKKNRSFKMKVITNYFKLEQGFKVNIWSVIVNKLLSSLFFHKHDLCYKYVKIGHENKFWYTITTMH